MKGIKNLTQAQLRKDLHYDPKTGFLTWLISGKGIQKNKRAGYLKMYRYRRIHYKKTEYLEHRLIWFYVYGYFSENDIDHINRNPADNRIDNLREASRQCNLRNTGNPKNNTSGVKGVMFFKHNNKWHAVVKVDGKNCSGGYYENFSDAVCARLALEQSLNWAGCDSLSPSSKYVKKYIQKG